MRKNIWYSLVSSAEYHNFTKQPILFMGKIQFGFFEGILFEVRGLCHVILKQYLCVYLQQHRQVIYKTMHR